MYKLKTDPLMFNASSHYYDNVWQGGRLALLDWLYDEFGAKTYDGYIYFKTEAQRNWFMLRFL